MIEKWQAVFSQYEGLEGLPYAEKVKACVAVDDELHLFLTALEGETRETKLSVLAAIFGSPYCYRALDQARPPSAVAYALISKGLYESGMCATPEDFGEEVEYLTDALEGVGLLVGVDKHRLSTLSNPNIDPMILQDEFDSTSGGDADLIDAILANSVSPERLLRRIFAGEFDASDSYEGHDLLMDLIKHPGIPRDVLEKIVARDFTWEMDEDALSEIATAVRQRLEQP